MLDVQKMSEEITSTISTWAFTSGTNILYALVITGVGLWIARYFSRIARVWLEKYKVDSLQAGFLATILQYAIIITALLTAASRIGMNMTSLIAVFGAAALAIGLAIKDNLSNFSSGILLVFFHPFAKGDYIEVSTTTGFVESIELFCTILNTTDNKKVFIPNSLVMNSVITNYSANDIRRVDLSIGIEYDADIPAAREVLESAVKEHPQVLTTPTPVIAVEALADSSVNITVRAWVPTSLYLASRFELLEKCKTALAEQGFSIPFPQMDVHMNK